MVVNAAPTLTMCAFVEAVAYWCGADVGAAASFPATLEALAGPVVALPLRFVGAMVD